MVKLIKKDFGVVCSIDNIMLNFREFVETSFNVTDYTPMRDNPESWAYKGLGKLGGVPIAAISGAVPAVGGIISALRGVKTRAYNNASYILDYLLRNPDIGKLVLDKVEQVVNQIEQSGQMGVITGGILPTVNPYGHSTLKDVGAAIWKGIMTSARNLSDTIFGSSGGNAQELLKFKESYKRFFEALGSMPKDRAFPLLKNFEHVLSMHGTGNELDRDIW